MSVLVENEYLRQIVILVAFTLVILLSPILIGLAILLVTTRWILTQYKNRYLPDHGNFLSGINNAFSCDDPYGPNPLANVSTYGLIRGRLKLEDVMALHSQKLEEFSRRRPVCFPELKQYLTSWMGFSCWRDEKNFQISDHIKMLSDVMTDIPDDGQVREDNMTTLCFELTKVPFKRDISPWQVLIHYNVKMTSATKNRLGIKDKEEVTLFLMRFHHTLADGLSIVTLFSHVFGIENTFDGFIEKFSKAKGKDKRSIWGKLTYALTFPILGTYDHIKHNLDFWDNNPWHSGWNKVRRDYIYTTFDTMPVDNIRKIRSAQGDIKFFTVLMAALTAAIRKYMIKHGVKVPRNMHVAVSVPIPKQSSTLSNNLTSMIYSLPVSLNDRTKVVQMIDDEAKYFQKSRHALAIYFFLGIFGLLPKNFTLSTWLFTTCAATNFPGFDKQVKFLGLPLIKIHGVARMASTVGIFFWSSGYDGNLDLGLGVSRDIMNTKEEILEFRGYIEEELEALKNPKNKIIV